MVDLARSSPSIENMNSNNNGTPDDKKINSVFNKLDRISLNLQKIGHEYDKIKASNCLDKVHEESKVPDDRKMTLPSIEEGCETGRSLETVAMLQESQSSVMFGASSA